MRTRHAPHARPPRYRLAGVADYSIDPAHSTLGFVARHAMVTNVKGK
ncbi:polyisoprenoid-binding protein, partial [Streptomyces sp. NPDC052127]